MFTTLAANEGKQYFAAVCFDLLIPVQRRLTRGVPEAIERSLSCDKPFEVERCKSFLSKKDAVHLRSI